MMMEVEECGKGNYFPYNYYAFTFFFKVICK